MKKFITVLVIVGMFIMGSTPALPAVSSDGNADKDCPGQCTLPETADPEPQEPAQTESEQMNKSLKVFFGTLALFLIIAAFASNDGNCDHEGRC